jgi:hypothetical protein
MLSLLQLFFLSRRQHREQSLNIEKKVEQRGIIQVAKITNFAQIKFFVIIVQAILYLHLSSKFMYC